MTYASSQSDYKEVNDARRHASTMNAIAPKTVVRLTYPSSLAKFHLHLTRLDVYIRKYVCTYAYHIYIIRVKSFV